jgi:ribosomal protein S18 acetylase RimI-like enzyme
MLRLTPQCNEVTELHKEVKYVIRNYKKGDEVRLAQIYSECFGPTTPRNIKKWHRRVGVLPGHIFIGEIKGKLVSGVELEFKKLHLGEEVYVKTGGIAGVCTDSDYRRRGIVTNLMKQALNYTKQSGISNSALFTDLDIPAHRIYSRFGFIDITTRELFVKYLDYPFVFKRWIRRRNRLLKHAKIAQRKLRGWEKSIVIELKDIGTLCFRFRRGRFQVLKKSPKTPDIIFYTDVKTYTRVSHGAIAWEEAVRSGKLVVKKGEPTDIEMLMRILRWIWEE